MAASSQRKVLDFMEMLVGGIIMADILINRGEVRELRKPPLPEEPSHFDHLAPPGSRALFHDHNTKWHGDELHIEGVDEWL